MDKRKRADAAEPPHEARDTLKGTVSMGKQDCEGSDYLCKRARKYCVTTKSHEMTGSSSSTHHQSSPCLPNRASQTASSSTPSSVTTTPLRDKMDRDALQLNGGDTPRGTTSHSPLTNSQNNNNNNNNKTGELETREQLAATMLCSMGPPGGGAAAAAAAAGAAEGNTTTATVLQSSEELAVSMLCSMAPQKGDKEAEQQQQQQQAQENTNLPPPSTDNQEQLMVASMLLRQMAPSDDDENDQEKPPYNDRKESCGLQTPEKLAVTMLCKMAPTTDDKSQPHSSDRQPAAATTVEAAATTTRAETPLSSDEEEEDEVARKTRKKRRKRDLSKPTLDSLVQDKFAGDVFHFLECVEREMNQHNFTATGLARMYGAVNCQSRFRTIVAELKEEPIVGMSRLWKERVQAYLRAKRGGETGQGSDSAIDERLRLVKTCLKKSPDKDMPAPLVTQLKRDEKVASAALGTMVGPNSVEPKLVPQQVPLPSVPPRKRHRPIADEGAKTTLDVLVQDKFGGDAFHFLQSVEKEMNKEGFTATGLARKYGAVNCQSRFRTIVAELKGEPIVGMSRLWKERVQAYLRAKEANGEAEDDSLTEEIAPHEDTLRLVQNNSKRVSPGTVGMFVRQTYDSDFNRFLQSLEDEMKLPGFSAASYARRHHITEGRKMLANIVAELKGLPNTTMTQTWKDRVQSYLAAKAKGEKIASVNSSEVSNEKVDKPNISNGEGESGYEAGQDSGSTKTVTLRFTEEGHPLGVLDTLVQTEFAGDVFAFLDYLTKEIQAPDFTAGTFARKHGVMEGKRTLQRIVAQLKGESAHSSQMWKDRVQAYVQYKAGGKSSTFHSVPHFGAKEAPMRAVVDPITVDVVKENATQLEETTPASNHAAV